MSTLLLFLSLATLSIHSVLCAPLDTAAPSATIDSGVVVGIQTSLPGSSVPINKFLGIPFAAPPVRFSPPVKPVPWTTPYQATQLSPACIQQFQYPVASRNLMMEAFNTPAPQESEDCLNLNVFAPALPYKEGNKLRPVMFWIYGGSLQFGSNASPAYDGTSFAANQGVILVVINYRTNVFGFPMSPDLPLTQRNLGFLDQRLALDWVQRNIRSFGGDPGRVTIFGESAGGSSVDELVTTWPVNPPFHAAIMESGLASLYVNPTNSPASWDTLISLLNCTTPDTLACARAAPASLLKQIEEVNSIVFKPVADNFTSLSYPEAARKAGRIAPVPILIGTNANEGTIFTIGQSNTTAFLQSQSYFSGQPALESAITTTYAIGTHGITDQASQIAAITTAFVYQCPASFLANDSSIHFPTWRYYYNSTFPNIQFVPGYDAGVYHSSEISLVFGTYSIDTGNGGPTANEIQLSALMQKAWADFAKNPKSGPRPDWKKFPSIAVLGGPGGKSSTGKLLSMTNTTKLDSGCEIFEPTMDALEG